AWSRAKTDGLGRWRAPSRRDPPCAQGFARACVSCRRCGSWKNGPGLHATPSRRDRLRWLAYYEEALGQDQNLLWQMKRSLGDSLLTMSSQKESFNTEGAESTKRQTLRELQGVTIDESPVRSSLLGVDADIVHEHLLRKLRGVIGRAGPGSTYRNIQENKERMIEHPSTSNRPLRLTHRLVEICVDIKPHRARLPLHCEEVKIVGEISAGGKAEGRA